MWSEGDRVVVLVDLCVFGRPVGLVWRKGRWRCPNGGCGVGSATGQDHQIAAPRALLATRAARRAAQQVGRGRAVSYVGKSNWNLLNTLTPPEIRSSPLRCLGRGVFSSLGLSGPVVVWTDFALLAGSTCCFGRNDQSNAAHKSLFLHG